MTSFSSSFGASSSYIGSGTALDSSFFAHWPPEAGCIGLSLSGVGGGVSSISAAVTDVARQFMARSITDGTSFQITHYAVGTSGYDVSNPVSALLVDPTSTSLMSEVYRKPIDLVETATLDATAKSFVARIGRTDLAAGIGEIALFATILDSPFISEIGTQFMYAVAHQPLNTKTLHHVVSYRIIVAL